MTAPVELTPEQLAELEDAYAKARGSLYNYVEAAGLQLQGHGSPVIATAYVVSFMTHNNWSMEFTREVAALALIELAYLQAVHA